MKKDKKIISYNPETGEPIYEEEQITEVETESVPVETTEQPVAEQPVVSEVNAESIPVESPKPVKPKKSKKGLIITIIVAVVVIVAGVLVAIFCFNGNEKKELTNIEARRVIRKYGNAVENAVQKYMDKEDEVPTFKDIKDNIKYDDYNVVCDKIKINYDGTVYLADCTIDEQEIKKSIVYGEEKEDPKPKEEEKEQIIYFYKSGDDIKYAMTDTNLKKNDIIAKYTCKKDYSCSVYYSELFPVTITESKKVFLFELSSDKSKSKIILYDLTNNKEVGSYTSAIMLYKDDYANNKDGEYILVQKSGSDQWGIIDKDGKLIHNYNIGRMKKSGIGSAKFYQTQYSIENDLILNYKDNKYGIVKITSNDVVIENKYDDIKLIDNKYFKAKENDKWYLYSLETKEKVLTDGYDYVIAAFDNEIVVINEKKIYIKDLSGNDLLETPIEDTSKDILEPKELCCANVPGVTAVKNDEGKIAITVYKDNKNNDKKDYIFDPATKTLSE